MKNNTAKDLLLEAVRALPDDEPCLLVTGAEPLAPDLAEDFARLLESQGRMQTAAGMRALSNHWRSQQDAEQTLPVVKYSRRHH